MNYDDACYLLNLLRKLNIQAAAKTINNEILLSRLDMWFDGSVYTPHINHVLPYADSTIKNSNK